MHLVFSRHGLEYHNILCSTEVHSVLIKMLEIQEKEGSVEQLPNKTDLNFTKISPMF